MAEWLGKALQKLLQRFESARDLRKSRLWRDVFYMITKIAHYTGLLACLAIIGACFMPWTYYTSIQQTFTGFNVVPFPNATYYGKAGIPISVMAGIIFMLMLIPKMWVKRVNLFVAAILVAYTIRTYVVFTSSLFEGEVEIFTGMYLVMGLSFAILVTTLFPKTASK